MNDIPKKNEKLTKVIPIAITMADGSLSVMSFVVDDGRGILRKPTPEAVAKEVIRAFSFPEALEKKNPKFIPKSWRQVEPSDLPGHRHFREAWRDDGTRISHDMDVCRQIHLARLRAIRQPMLDQLDRLWNRANGQGKPKEAQQIEDSRKALRDFPVTMAKHFNDAKTPEDLLELSIDSIGGF